MSESIDDTQKKLSRLLRPLDPVDVIRDRLDEQTARLTNAARLMNELAQLSKTRPNGFASEAYLRAVNNATENFGVECEAYSDLTQELNITVGSEENS